MSLRMMKKAAEAHLPMLPTLYNLGWVGDTQRLLAVVEEQAKSFKSIEELKLAVESASTYMMALAEVNIHTDEVSWVASFDDAMHTNIARTHLNLARAGTADTVAEIMELRDEALDALMMHEQHVQVVMKVLHLLGIRVIARKVTGGNS